jgi:hypothetical protein
MEINAERTKVMGIPRQLSPIQIMTDQNRLENVEYCKYFGKMIIYVRYTREIKSRIAMTKAAFNKRTVFTSKLDLNIKEETDKMLHFNTAMYGAETWTLRKADLSYLESLKCGAGEG